MYNGMGVREMKRFAAVVLCAFIMALLPTAAFADMGPKPSVRISIDGLEPGRECWGTLLGEKTSTGPASVYDGTNQYLDLAPEEIWRAFVGYEDADGYYFLQRLWLCSEDGQLWWGYYPPDDFKLLLYFPDTGEFAVSGSHEAYAFKSYFAAELDHGELALERSYDYGAEVPGFLLRMLLTIALELGVAWCMGYRSRSQVKIIAVINICTQLALNLALNLIAYYQGSFMFAFRFLLMELAIFIAEAVLYRVFFRRAGEEIGVKRAIGLSAAGNACSYLLGLFLASVVPGVF